MFVKILIQSMYFKLIYEQIDQTKSIWIAAEKGYIEQVISYISNGLDVNTVNSNRVSLLQIAIKNGHRTIVEFLCNVPGVYLDWYDINYDCALNYAVRSDDEFMVSMLLKYGANILKIKWSRFSPLHEAVYYTNNLKIVKHDTTIHSTLCI